MKKLAPAWLTQVAFYWFPAIGLHAAVLLVPIPPASPPAPISETPVKIIRVPRQPSVRPPAPVQSPAVVAPIAQAQPKAPSPATATKAPPPRVVENRATALVVKPSPAPTPAAIAPSSTPSPAPTPSPTPLPTPSPAPTPIDALTDFSQATGATPSCAPGTACWQVEDSQFRTVAEKLTSDLTAKGYQVEPQDQEEDAGMWIAKVSKSGSTDYYLHVLNINGTTFFRAAEPLSLEAAKQHAGIHS